MDLVRGSIPLRKCLRVLLLLSLLVLTRIFLEDLNLALVVLSAKKRIPYFIENKWAVQDQVHIRCQHNLREQPETVLSTEGTSPRLEHLIEASTTCLNGLLVQTSTTLPNSLRHLTATRFLWLRVQMKPKWLKVPCCLIHTPIIYRTKWLSKWARQNQFWADLLRLMAWRTMECLVQASILKLSLKQFLVSRSCSIPVKLGEIQQILLKWKELGIWGQWLINHLIPLNSEQIT